MLASEDAQMRHAAFRPGSTIADKYIVERVVGEGGLGVVVSAHHKDLDQTVAIKYLRPKVLGSRVVVERFLREARLAAKIRSQHVVRVFDVGTLPEGGMPYMIMECLQGTDLGQVLATSGPLSVERAVDYVLQACEALAEAHASGIVHRDLKPDNLFLATGAAGKTVVKVLDFGISKLTAKRSETGRLITGELTEANDQFGTPVYMSPEQLRSSADVDARADVWAVGVILYELLSGKMPFEGAGLPELVTAILTAKPAPLEAACPHLSPKVRELLESVIDRCLEKERDKRFQNIAEFAQELRGFATPAGQASIDHIVSIVREGGDHVRPTTPAPTESQARAIREALTLTPNESRASLTTSNGAASWGMRTHHSLLAPSSKRTGLAFVAAAGVAVALIFVFTRGRDQAQASSSAAQGGHVVEAAKAAGEPAMAAPKAASPPGPVEPQTAPLEAPLAQAAQAATSDDTSAPDASMVAARVARPATATGPRIGRAKPSAPSTASSPASQSPLDPNAVINPFQ
jgi:serine/threonine-protein kinase